MSDEDSATRVSILCVDNDAESRAIHAQLFSDYQLRFASDAFQALSAVNGRAFDAYILESWLPDWSGPALCREIRKLDPHAPILFCTAAAQDKDRARGMRAGATAYLCKPVDPNDLRSKLRAFVTLAKMESEQARVEAQRTLEQEWDRRLASAHVDVERMDAATVASIERTARSRALAAFLEARGARAHFDAWWPRLFAAACTKRQEA